MSHTVNPRTAGHAGFEPLSPVSPLQPLPDQRGPAAAPEVPEQPLARPVNVLFEPDGMASSSLRAVTPPSRGTGYLPYRFNISGLITIGSEIPLPELEYFWDASLGKDLDIEIRVGRVGRSSPRARARLVKFEHPAGLRYEEHFGRLGANFSIDLEDRIHVTVSRMLAHSPHVVYTNILEALLRYAIAARGGMLLHSACVELEGRGVMLSARTDTGKTGTVLRMLRERGALFLSDDMTILWPDATAQCFPKPMTISNHTLRAVDPGDLSHTEWAVLSLKSRLHSKSGRGIGMRIGDRNLPVMTANALTQMLIPPPKYRADRLVSCDVVPSTTVRELFIIERGTPALHDLGVAEALGELMDNTDDAYGFPPYRYLAPVLVVGGEEFDVLREREQRVLRSALERVRVRRMVSDTFGWADEIPDLVHTD
jgi:dolichol-phosphate mannosyltransferase